MIKKKTRRSREFKITARFSDIEEARRLRKKKRKKRGKKKYKVRKNQVCRNAAPGGEKSPAQTDYLSFFLPSLASSPRPLSILNLKLTEARTLKEQQDLLAQKARRSGSIPRSTAGIYRTAGNGQTEDDTPRRDFIVLPEKDDTKKTTGGGSCRIDRARGNAAAKRPKPSATGDHMIKEIIVVEGRDDEAAVKKAVEAETIATPRLRNISGYLCPH
jgi:hypothetical protein